MVINTSLACSNPSYTPFKQTYIPPEEMESFELKSRRITIVGEHSTLPERHGEHVLCSAVATSLPTQRKHLRQFSWVRLAYNVSRYVAPYVAVFCIARLAANLGYVASTSVLVGGLMAQGAIFGVGIGTALVAYQLASLVVQLLHVSQKVVVNRLYFLGAVAGLTKILSSKIPSRYDSFATIAGGLAGGVMGHTMYKVFGGVALPITSAATTGIFIGAASLVLPLAKKICDHTYLYDPSMTER